ncbi:hypothetical protein HZS_3644, partial [Henneguya salminicola]
MNISVSRVSKELAEIQRNKNKDGILIESINDKLSDLKGYFDGPTGTPYEGGKFVVKINIPERYPFIPPVVQFETKIWHPNISSVTGTICLDILKDEWAAAMSLRTVIVSIQALLCNPEPDDPQDAVVASQLLSFPKIFSGIAKQWTRIYANALFDSPENKEFDKKIEQLIQLGIKPVLLKYINNIERSNRCF